MVKAPIPLPGASAPAGAQGKDAGEGDSAQEGD
jgi:hypothetical protein